MIRDRLGSTSTSGPAEEPRQGTGTPTRAFRLGRLAQSARAVALVALGLGLGVLSLFAGLQASQRTPVVLAAAAPVIAQRSVAAPETAFAIAQASTPTPAAPTSAATPIAVQPIVEIAEVEPVASSAVEPVVSQDELIQDLRPQLSARGGRNASEATQPAAPTTSAPALPSQQMLTSTGVSAIAVKAAAAKPAATKAALKAAAPRPVVKAATPKPAPTKRPTPRPASTPAASSTLGQRVVSIALRYIGYRYTYGGVSPSTGFDCSGFVYYVYKAAGHPISRDINVQYRTGVAVSRSSLKPGDMVFFKNTYKAGSSHASIYIGGGRIVHAQSETTGVTTTALSTSYWSTRYLGARRP